MGIEVVVKNQTTKVFVVSAILTIGMPVFAQNHTSGNYPYQPSSNPYPKYTPRYVENPDLQKIKQGQTEQYQAYEAREAEKRAEAARMREIQEQQRLQRQAALEAQRQRDQEMVERLRQEREARQQAAQERNRQMQEEARRLNRLQYRH